MLDLLRSLLGLGPGGPKEPERAVEIPVEEVAAYVRGRTQDEVRRAADRLDELAGSIHDGLSRLESQVDELASLELGEGVDQRLGRAAMEARVQLKRKMTVAIRKVARPGDWSVGSSAAYASSLESSLATLSQASAAHVYYLATVFPKETEALGRTVKELASLHRELVSALAGLRPLAGVGELEALAAELSEVSEAGGRAEEERARLRARLDGLAGEVRDAEREREEARADEGAVEAEISAARARMRESEGRLDASLECVKKALKRHAAKLLPEEGLQGAKGYLKDPLGALFMEGPDHLLLTRLVEALLKASAADSGLGGEKAHKVRAGLESIRSGSLEPLLAEHRELEGRARALEAARPSHPAVQRARRLDERLRELSRAREGAERELASLAREAGSHARRADEALARMGRLASSLVGHAVLPAAPSKRF